MPGRSDLSQCRPGPDLYCSSATKPWPRYDLLIWLDGNGNSSYEGMIAKYHHRAAWSLTLGAEYTFAKAISNSWQSNTAPLGQISDCRRCDKGPATFDIRQRFVATAVWEVPFARRRTYGGWTLTGIITFSTGQPVLLTAPTGAAGIYLTQLPNRVCDGRNTARSGSLRHNGFVWFDAQCFPLAPQGYFGTSGRTVISGPGVNNWDLGLEKPLPLPRDSPVNALLRAEAFNAWNHTQFGPPNGDAGAGVNFGRISSTRPPRLMQIGVKLLW